MCSMKCSTYIPRYKDREVGGRTGKFFVRLATPSWPLEKLQLTPMCLHHTVTTNASALVHHCGG